MSPYSTSFKKTFQLNTHYLSCWVKIMSFYESKYRKCKNRFTFFALYIVLNIQYIPQLKYNERNIHKRFTVISYEIKKKKSLF
jgi:hypothetical protein